MNGRVKGMRGSTCMNKKKRERKEITNQQILQENKEITDVYLATRTPRTNTHIAAQLHKKSCT